jgi:hypothetical protein
MTGRHYRVRAALVCAQAAGAVVGMTIGAVLPTTTPWVVAVATVVAGLCGVVGAIGPASTAFGMMGVIGLAFTQFSRLGMPWWEPPLWYLLGSGLVLVAGLVGALHHPRRYQRAALAEVFAASAALVRAPADDDARARLARASAGAREAVLGYRIRDPGHGEIDELWAAAQATALRVASHVPDDGPTAAELDRDAAAVRDGRPIDVDRSPAPARSAPVIPRDRVRDPDALLVGAVRLLDDPRLAGARDEAYRRAHAWHDALLQRLADPPPAGPAAAAWAPVAARLEDLVDAVSAAGARIRAGSEAPDDGARREIVRAISAADRIDDAVAALTSVGHRGDPGPP